MDDLQTHDWAKQLLVVLKRRLTGQLRVFVRAPSESFTLHVRHGMPVFLEGRFSDVQSLGALLIEQGAVKRENLETSMAEPSAEPTRLGNLLIQRKLLDELGLRRGLALQCFRKLVDVFAADIESVRFEPHEDPEVRELLPVSVMKVLWAGVREHYDLTRMGSVFPQLWTQSWRRANTTGQISERLGLGPQEESIIAALDRAHTYAELCQKFGTPLLVAQLLYVLDSTEQIIACKEITAANGEISLEAELQKLESIIARSGNAFELFRLPTTASREDVHGRWTELRHTFHPDRLPSQGLRHLHQRVEAVFATLSAAHQILGNDTSRDELRQTLELGTAYEVAEARLRGEALMQTAERLLYHGKLSEAKQAYEDAKKLLPEDPLVIAGWLWCEYQTQAPDSSRAQSVAKEFDQLMGEHPNVAKLHFLHGLLLTRTGHNDRALLAFGRALELNPNFLDAKRQLKAVELRIQKAQNPTLQKPARFGRFR